MEYYPGKVPQNPAELPGFLLDEFRRLQQALAAPQKTVRFVTLYAEPEKYSEGDVVKADGTTWNPGSGAGIYERRGGAWVFIG